MDPLSVAGSIVGIVSIADVVVRRGYKYIRDVKGAAKEVKALIEEVNSLSGVLHTLQNIAVLFEEDELDTNPLTQVRSIEACLQTLKAVESHLVLVDPSSSCSKTGKAKNMLKWTLNKSRTQDLLQEVEKHRSTMTFAARANNMCNMLSLLEGQNSVLESLQRLGEAFEEDKEVRLKSVLTEERRKWLNSFTTVDAQAWQDANIRLRQPGTGIWFLEGPEFIDWVRSSQSKLWVHGIAGAGKTILMSTIIQEIEKFADHNNALAFFNCDYKNKDTHDPVNILGSLARQIALHNDKCFGDVRAFYKGLTASVDGTPRKPLPEELCDLIKKLSTKFRNVSIIVDELDEILVERADVAELLASLNHSAGNIRTLFASRHEIDLTYVLRDFQTISIAARSSDLRLYVHSEIESRIKKRKMRIQDGNLKDYIARTLVEGADGMFRWVACQIDYLCECTTDKERREALLKLPPTLPASYERILERVNSSPNKSMQKMVTRTLNWILFAKESLTPQGLLEAIAIDIGDVRLPSEDSLTTEDEILHWCSSLPRRRRQGGLEFAHYTVREFLFSLDTVMQPQFVPFKMTQAAGDLYIATSCLTYLNTVTLRDAAVTITERNVKSSLPTIVCKHHLLSYAAKYWPDHFRACFHNDVVTGLARQLLNPSLTPQFHLWRIMYRLMRISGRRALAEERGTTMAERLQRALARDKFGSWDHLKAVAPLSWAAMLNFPDLCLWLIEQGEDVDGVSQARVGSNLFFAILGGRALHIAVSDRQPGRNLYSLVFYFHHSRLASQIRTISVLLEAGAKFDTTAFEKMPFLPLSIVLTCRASNDGSLLFPKLWKPLLDAGAQVQTIDIHWMLLHCGCYDKEFKEWLLLQVLTSFEPACHSLLCWLCVYFSDFTNLATHPLLATMRNFIVEPTVEDILIKEIKIWIEGYRHELSSEYSSSEPVGSESGSASGSGYNSELDSEPGSESGSDSVMEVVNVFVGEPGRGFKHKISFLQAYSLLQEQSREVTALLGLLKVFRMVLSSIIKEHKFIMLARWIQEDSRLIKSIIQEPDLKDQQIHVAISGYRSSTSTLSLPLYETISLLIRSDEDPVQLNSNQDTPFHEVVCFGDISLLNLLWEAKPDIEVFSLKNAAGLSVIDVARRKSSNEEVIAYIENKYFLSELLCNEFLWDILPFREESESNSGTEATAFDNDGASSTINITQPSGIEADSGGSLHNRTHYRLVPIPPGELAAYKFSRDTLPAHLHRLRYRYDKEAWCRRPATEGSGFVHEPLFIIHHSVESLMTRDLKYNSNEGDRSVVFRESDTENDPENDDDQSSETDPDFIDW